MIDACEKWWYLIYGPRINSICFSFKDYIDNLTRDNDIYSVLLNFDDKYKARVVFDYIRDKFRIDILFIDTNKIIIEKENLEEHEVVDILKNIEKKIEDKNERNNN